MAGKITLSTINQKYSKNTGTVFFFHGSGDSGQGMIQWLRIIVGDFRLPHIKFVFPTGPLIPYTPLNGQLSAVWFDRLEINPFVTEHKESLDEAGHEIMKIILSEVENGVPLNRIIVGGFSMGGCVALHTAYMLLPGLGGVFTLSSFLNNGSELYEKLESTGDIAKYLPPLLICHGDRDTVGPIQWGKNTLHKLIELKIQGEFVPIEDTLHELATDEIKMLLEWISKVVPD